MSLLVNAVAQLKVFWDKNTSALSQQIKYYWTALYFDSPCGSFLLERQSATGIILKQGGEEKERLQAATFPRSRHWHARNNVIIIIITVYFKWSVCIWFRQCISSLPASVCDGLTVTKMLNNTDTDTFFRYQIFSIPIHVLFSVSNFTVTGSKNHQKIEKFPAPVLIRYRYPLQIFQIPKFWRRKSVLVSNFSDTGSETFLRY